MCELFWIIREEEINWRIDGLFSSRIIKAKLALEYAIKVEFTNHSLDQIPPNSITISEFFSPLFPYISVLSKTESKAVLNIKDTGLLLA